MSMSRRSFLKATVTTAGALVVYVNTAPLASAKAAKANPMPFIEMAPNGDITFISSRSDMGQGSPTSLAQVLYDEMDADWDKLVAVKETWANDISVYNDPLGTIGAASTFIGW
ncbi:MAG: molybdopterin-dependent oxidoreductase, partial [Kordiimonadaceae bacterium]|nr:molybdopterin-dependent oxidoreductase [Kordiimonadaceae bacterium]